MAAPRPILAVLTGLLAASAITANAHADVQVTQKDKGFQPGKITVETGETVTFLNKDDTGHNIIVRNEKKQFNAGYQPPGETVTTSFSEPGTYTVRCVIHPSMKLVVTVK